MVRGAGKLISTALAFAAAVAWSLSAVAQDVATNSPSAPPENPYSSLTDREWIELASDWESLSRAERRWFLTESRKRRGTRRAPGKPKPAPAFVYRERARFGWVRAQANGDAAKPAADSKHLRDTAKQKMKFGLGFEERQRERARHGVNAGVTAASTEPARRTQTRKTQAPPQASGRPQGGSKPQGDAQTGSAP